MDEHILTIEFPLRGEWYAPNTPADKIPSHGTNRMGMRFAFDFMQINWTNKKKPFHTISDFHYLLTKTSLNYYYCYNQPIFAPFDGEIITVIDGMPERETIHWLVEQIRGIKKSISFDEQKNNFSEIAGNYIIMKHTENVYALFAHLKPNSITVSEKEIVKKGSVLENVGHSGNSTSPHLHFQLMDRPDIATAEGLPFHFKKYELFKNNNWITVYNQIPTKLDRFRYYDC